MLKDLTRSGHLMFGDGKLNLIGVDTRISPGVGQVFSAQGRIVPQQISLAGPKPARLYEQPNWDSRADNVRLTAHNTRINCNAGE